MSLVAALVITAVCTAVSWVIGEIMTGTKTTYGSSTEDGPCTVPSFRRYVASTVAPPAVSALLAIALTKVFL
jgi:hypothetical protein